MDAISIFPNVFGLKYNKFNIWPKNIYQFRIFITDTVFIRYIHGYNIILVNIKWHCNVNGGILCVRKR